jgi:hypothetical protein
VSYREIDIVFENFYLLPPLSLSGYSSHTVCLSLTHTYTNTRTHDSTQFRTQNGPLFLPVYNASSRFATLRLRFPIQPYFSPVAVFRVNFVLTAFSTVPATAMILDCSSAHIRDKQFHIDLQGHDKIKPPSK